MVRPLRIEYPDAWYHVTCRGVARSAKSEEDERTGDGSRVGKNKRGTGQSGPQGNAGTNSERGAPVKKSREDHIQASNLVFGGLLPKSFPSLF